METNLKLITKVLTNFNIIEIYPYPNLTLGIKPLKINIATTICPVTTEKGIVLADLKFDSESKSIFDPELIFELGKIFGGIQNIENLLKELIKIKKDYSVIIRFSKPQGNFHYLEELVQKEKLADDEGVETSFSELSKKAYLRSKEKPEKPSEELKYKGYIQQIDKEYVYINVTDTKILRVPTKDFHYKINVNLPIYLTISFPIEENIIKKKPYHEND